MENRCSVLRDWFPDSAEIKMQHGQFQCVG